MPGLGLVYAIGTIAALLPGMAAAALVLALTRRAARGTPARPSWALVGLAATAAGIAVAFAAIVVSPMDPDWPPAWVLPLDAVAIGAALIAAASVGAAVVWRHRAAPGRWIGPIAGCGILGGALLGFFVLPRVGPVGDALGYAACSRDPFCFTAEEDAAAAEIDGTATLWISGVAAADGVTAGARCEHGAPEDGYVVRAAFAQADPPTEVELAVMDDGSYRALVITAGSHEALPGKGWDPATSVRVEAGSTPANGRFVFTDLRPLGPSGDLEPGTTMSGEVSWSCPGFAP
jgi:hypothetical protein